ncbi:MAG TPA: methionine adenosyltransferase [Thermoanaerobaculia bacterium]|jgi:S-adenosylmethionine synthetase|nr:methionine adenosyltransferase [Thermoanaerobaculia bacterium]
MVTAASVESVESQETLTAANYTFTSESVTEGHPDKVCDFVADTILDACIEQDPTSRVACEVLVKERRLVVAGEITSAAKIDRDALARAAVREIGYVYDDEPFNADGIEVFDWISAQSSEIAQGVDRAVAAEQGAGDQGIMFGYATDETPELMPLPILLAHQLARGLAEDRKNGSEAWLRPDGKTQVSVVYENDRPVAVADVLVSTQHTADATRERIAEYVATRLSPRILGRWLTASTRFIVNPTGSFVHGGPSADCGVTGRKIIVDSYGGMGRHGGGAFSGKDPSKVDRSGAYFCRWVARQIVSQQLARRAEVQVSYAIGQAKPVSVKVDTFGTGDTAAAEEVVRRLDFRPAAIIERLRLLRPLYRQTTNYGHFGKPGLPWEE